MRLIVAFSSQLTTSSLYKLAVHRAIFLPYVTSSEYRRLARDVTATRNHAHLGTRSIASVTSPVETFLCNQHYQQVYRLLNAKSEGCRTCGVKRRHVHSATVSTINLVTCPDPKWVESFLKDNIEFSDTIREGDQICYTCYKFINQILNSDVCMLSSDC